MSAIVAILILGLKMATNKPPVELKNLKLESKGRGKGNVDSTFWRRIFRLIKKVIPSWTCIEMQYTVLLSVLLIVRTMMSIWLADVNG